MGSLKLYATMAGFLAVAASSVTARAADLLPPPPMPEPIDFATGGWYLRGDIGFSNQRVDRFENPIAPVGTTVFQKGFDSAPFGGVGVGYKFNDWLRVDATAEYRGRANFHGYDRYPDAFAPNGTGFGTNEYTGSKSEVVALANLYIDLGTWHGFTPFIGGGVGYANIMVHDFRDTNVTTGGVAAGRDISSDNFAWAAHAGVSYAVTPNFSIEFAYRYLNMGDARFPAVTTFIGTPGAPAGRFRDIDSHDFKVGMRWMLGDNGVEHPPLIRKY